MAKPASSGSNTNSIKRQYDFLYESISRKLERQVDSLGAIDTKANILLVAIGALMAGYFQLLSNSGLSNFRSYKILVILEILCFTFSGYFIFRTFLFRSWPIHKKERLRDDPNPTKLLNVFEKNSQKGEYWLKNRVIRSMAAAYQLNEQLIEKKYDNFRRAKILLFTGVGILFFHLVFTLYNINDIHLMVRK